MAGCAFCKSETEFYDGGVPICVRCSDARGSKRKPPTSEHQLLNVLREDLQSAKERARAATAAFDAVARSLARYLNRVEHSEFTTPRVR